MSLFKRSEQNVNESTQPVITNYIGAHPVLAFKPTSEESGNNHLGNYDQVTPFENSEGLGSWLGKKADKAAGAVTKVARSGVGAVTNKGRQARTYVTNKRAKKKEEAADRVANDKSDQAAASIVAALRKGNKSVDAELANAWTVVQKQRRKDNKPTSGDAAAKKKLIEEIRLEVWNELTGTGRKKSKTPKLDKEILAAFDNLKEEN